MLADHTLVLLIALLQVTELSLLQGSLLLGLLLLKLLHRIFVALAERILILRVRPVCTSTS